MNLYFENMADANFDSKKHKTKIDNVESEFLPKIITKTKDTLDIYKNILYLAKSCICRAFEIKELLQTQDKNIYNIQAILAEVEVKS